MLAIEFWLKISGNTIKRSKLLWMTVRSVSPPPKKKNYQSPKVREMLAYSIDLNRLNISSKEFETLNRWLNKPIHSLLLCFKQNNQIIFVGYLNGRFLMDLLIFVSYSEIHRKILLPQFWLGLVLQGEIWNF